jgi:drug/metabolite transporter (DMT)-like permease
MHRQAYVLLLLTALFWGGNAVAGKLAVGHVSPMTLTALRWAGAVLILLSFGLPRLRREWPLMRPHLMTLGALGAVGFTLFNITLYSALKYTSAINVSIEQAGMPMVIFLVNFLLFGLRVTWAQILGFLLSLAGVALTASHGSFGQLLALDLNRGDALMLLAICLYGGYTVALRFLPRLHWLTTMTVMAVSATLVSLPFAAWEITAGAAILPDMQGWAVVAYTAIFPSILAQVFYMRGVHLLGGNRAGLFINMVPVFGALLAVIILGERFAAYHAVAMVLVLGGIWLAERSGRRTAETHPAD